jgi:alpha-ketoglutarate-dependent taurine dioxygenase
VGYQTIEVRKVTPTIGAEIRGVDLAQPLGNQQFQEIHDAVMDNLVVFFRDQEITVEQHIAFGRRFGDPIVHPAASSTIPGHPEIRVVKSDENTVQATGEVWHSDLSCQPEPPMGSILYIKEVPPDGGGDTAFANTYRAYETLSARMKAHIEGLTAIHDSAHVYTRPSYDTKADRELPRAEHPIVRTHPVTGRKGLFVNRGFTTRIVGLPADESAAILEYLLRHIETPEFQCRFAWRRNSIALWDNRCAQHRAIYDYHPHRRYGHRVTIRGDKPFYRA